METETWSCTEGDFAVHVDGSGPPLVLIHGIGPGTSVMANFQAVLPALVARRTVVGIDLIGFGASPTKHVQPYFDIELWVSQALAVIDRVADERLAIWGQSLGAAVALRAASRSKTPIARIIGTGSGGGLMAVNDAMNGFWSAPSSADQLLATMQLAVHDASMLSAEQIAVRYQSLVDGGRAPYFRDMMSGDRQALLQTCRLAPEELRRVDADVLLIHGREDRPVPYRESALHLFDHLPRCKLALLSRCGHNPMLEHTQDVLALALDHLSS